MSEERKRIVIPVGGVSVDITELPPITLGDKRALKALSLDLSKLGAAGRLEPEEEATLVLFLLRKVAPGLTAEAVDTLPAITAARVVSYAMRRSAEVDDPFSTGSTPSPLSTGGEPQTSSNSAPLS